MNRQGFTILELVVVLLLLSILSSVGVLHFKTDRLRVQLLGSLTDARQWADAIKFIPVGELTHGRLVREISPEYHSAAVLTPFMTPYTIANTAQGLGIRFEVPLEVRLSLYGTSQIRNGRTIITILPQPWIPGLAGIEKKLFYSTDSH